MARLPPWLPASASVDLRQVIAGIRPVARTQLQHTIAITSMKRWFYNRQLHVAFDREGFVVLSRYSNLLARLLELDRRESSHTFALGRALGYPYCCCRAAADVGESHLDAWAASMDRSEFLGAFRHIDPSLYVTGRGFISHIPCTARCRPSLLMAQSVFLHELRRQGQQRGPKFVPDEEIVAHAEKLNLANCPSS